MLQSQINWQIKCADLYVKNLVIYDGNYADIPISFKHSISLGGEFDLYWVLLFVIVFQMNLNLANICELLEWYVFAL